MKLHSYWRSTAAYRVRIALNLKQTPYEMVTHDLRTGEQRAAGYLAIAPQGLVPALETPKGVITQSLAIMEWLEEAFPAPPLLPASAHERATVRAMAALVACDIHPLNNLRVLAALRSEFGADGEQVKAWIGHWITAGFSALEQQIADFGGDYAFGDAPSLADCALVPQVYSARRFEVDLERFPLIRKVSAFADQLPAFEAARPDAQPDAPQE